MGARRRCCCDCYEFRDDFDGGDSTDLGANWGECSGDWEIASDHLVANGAGIVSLKKMVGKQVGKLTVYCEELTVGTIVSLRAFYGTEASPCTAKLSWKLKFTVLTSSTAKLELLDTAGNVKQVQNISFSASEVGLILCVGPERIDGSSNVTYHLLSCVCTDGMPNGCAHEGYWFAIENESSETVKIEYVEYIDHYSHNVKCPDCLCGCEGNCLPDTLTATIRDAGLCTVQDGKTFTLTKDPHSCAWGMDRENWDGCCIKLALSGGAINEYGLATEWGLTDLVASTSFLAEVGSTCDPVYLVFGPTKNSCDTPNCPTGWRCCEGDCLGTPYPGNQGQYSIEITE
jgi:hypothetical protein